MLLNIFKQRDWIVDRRLIKAVNDVARTQSRRRRRRVWFDFVDDRRFRRQDEQLANTFSTPAARLRFVRLHMDRLHLSVALELYWNGLALAPHYRPAHAVVHPQKTRHAFII